MDVNGAVKITRDAISTEVGSVVAVPSILKEAAVRRSIPICLAKYAPSIRNAIDLTGNAAACVDSAGDVQRRLRVPCPHADFAVGGNSHQVTGAVVSWNFNVNVIPN